MSKNLGADAISQKIDLEIESGELPALLGPSGSGRTTLLRLIAALDSPSRGAVLCEGEDASRFTVQGLRVGFVFQPYVAFARALAIEPRVPLLDEPFGALYAKVRKDLRRWLRDIHDRTGLTTVFVTHDQAGAMSIADRDAILNGGSIEQIGRLEEVRSAPATPFVAAFLE